MLLLYGHLFFLYLLDCCDISCSSGAQIGGGDDKFEALQGERWGEVGGQAEDQVPQPDESLQWLCWEGITNFWEFEQ